MHLPEKVETKNILKLPSVKLNVPDKMSRKEIYEIYGARPN